MGRINKKLVTGILGILLLLNGAIWTLPNIAVAQWQQRFQAEQIRQALERQQWLQWQRQEQMRQMYDRQQWLQWQQQERLRQILQR
jgi:hypothetical protein